MSISVNLCSQDMLVDFYCNETPVNIITFSPTLIKYKKLNIADGPTYIKPTSDYFRIYVKGQLAINNDRFSNPYPGTLAVVPVSMRRLEYYEPNLVNEIKRDSYSYYKDLISMYDTTTSTNNDVRVKKIFKRVLNSTLTYFKDKGYNIAEGFEWQYVYAKCKGDHKDENHCSLFGLGFNASEVHEYHSDINNASSFGFGKFLLGDIMLGELNDDEIAGIIGHEIGHAIAQHALDSYRKNKNAKNTAFWGGLALAMYAGTDVQSTQYIAGEIGDTFFLKPFNRNQELEADMIGVVLMSLAGYDPNKIADYWKLKSFTNNTPEWESTHPSDANRCKQIIDFINTNEFKQMIYGY